jgi:hypothetical protein
MIVPLHATKKQVQKLVNTTINTGVQNLTNEMYNLVQKYCRSLYVCISRLSFDHFTIVRTSGIMMFKHRGKRHRRRKGRGSCLIFPFPSAVAVSELSRRGQPHWRDWPSTDGCRIQLLSHHFS